MTVYLPDACHGDSACIQNIFMQIMKLPKIHKLVFFIVISNEFEFVYYRSTISVCEIVL